ncbi:MAG TPA: hypothetical protein DDW33_16265 [Ktedonobacter sp.]|nr:hypothetical protein [Ktedonobacter sp.]HBE27229.1 hypothetical protein [Ktedonobacter sp.]HBE29406.1 hypothetical protein [Ktedonobacter sp.]HCF85158.1 hypothetical protein [Ktedonobacter sp.]
MYQFLRESGLPCERQPTQHIQIRLFHAVFPFSCNGIEPNAEMRAQAERQQFLSPHGERIEYRDGLSTQTDLETDSVDIVTCSQSLHWMEPEPTFAEVTRILRPGGLFVAYDYDWQHNKRDAILLSSSSGGRQLCRLW